MRQFEHHFIEAEAGFDAWGAMTVGDFDGDGRPEFCTGGKGGGFFFCYDFDVAAQQWVKHTISMDLKPNVGAAAFDWDGDGRAEVVCGEWGPTLWYFRAMDSTLDRWERFPIFVGLRDPHDVLAASLTGGELPEVIVREKDGALRVFQAKDNPTEPWTLLSTLPDLPGDGTAVGPIAREDRLDLVTNCGWFENVDGSARHWQQHPLIPPELGLHPETRVAVAKRNEPARPPMVFVSESEIRDARLFALRFEGTDRPWRPLEVLSRADLYNGLHSLQVVDIDGDGIGEVITAEMENRRTDGVERKPRWLALKPSAGHVLLDQNLGSHSAMAADFDGDGALELVGKVWRANAVNGANGHNHVDWLRPIMGGDSR